MPIWFDPVSGALFWSGVFIAAAGLPVCLFMRGGRVRNSFFIFALVAAVSWRMTLFYLGYHQSRRYFMPAATLIMLLMPGAIWLVCSAVRTILHRFLKIRKGIWRPAVKIVGFALLCAAVVANIAKTFHNTARHVTERETISLIEKYLAGSENRLCVLSRAKLGLRLKYLLPATEVRLYNHNADTDLSERDLDRIVYDLALARKDFLIVLSDDVKHPDVPFKVCLGQMLGVFPFDRLFCRIGPRNAYSVYKYNRRIGVSATRKEIPGEAVLPLRKTKSGYRADLTPLLSADEFATPGDTDAKFAIRGKYLHIQSAAPPPNGKKLKLFVCNALSWPIREYSGEWRNDGGRPAMKFTLTRSAEVLEAAPETVYFSTNHMPKAFLPRGGTIVGDNLFLPPGDAGIALSIRGAAAAGKNLFEFPGGEPRRECEVDIDSPAAAFKRRWKLTVHQPPAHLPERKLAVLVVGNVLEQKKKQAAFTRCIKEISKTGEVDFHYPANLSFYNFATAENDLTKLLRKKKYDFVIVDVGDNDVLWHGGLWNDPRLAAARERELTAALRQLAKRFPDTAFALMIPQPPAPGEAFYRQGIPANWRMKTRAHHVLSNVLYKVEKDAEAGNLDALPAFCGIAEDDYSRLQDGTFQYTFSLSPRGYEKLAKAAAAWIAVKMEYRK